MIAVGARRATLNGAEVGLDFIRQIRRSRNSQNSHGLSRSGTRLAAASGDKSCQRLCKIIAIGSTLMASRHRLRAERKLDNRLAIAFRC